MKKLGALLSLIWIIGSFFNFTTAEASYNRYFVVTAYYSPLPGQTYYLKWNFEAEKRLNGNWTHWASWRGVFEWMLAAPKNYGFWTMIQLEWVGVWVVADRWGAIVNAWQRWYRHDRIDIWMWYGEEGLKRALKWWKRTIRWKIVWYDRNATWSVDVDKFPAPQSAVARLSQAGSIYSKGIWIWDARKNILELQNLLRAKGLYSGPIDWRYNKTLISELVDFQLKNNLIKTEYDYWAGYWWTKTRALVKTLPYNESYNQTEATEKAPSQWKKITKSWIESIFTKTVWPYSPENEVKDLQKVMKHIWRYEWEIDGRFDKDFKNTLIKYQIDTKVILSENNLWAWYFGPKTREQAKADYNVYTALEKQKVAREEAEKIAKEQEEKMKKELIAKSNIHSEKVLDTIGKPTVWSVGQNVRILQKTLHFLGYFNTKDSAIYGQVTKNAVTKFQIAHHVIENENAHWAWYFGPKTRKKMKEVLAKKLYEEGIKNNKALTYAWK